MFALCQLLLLPKGVGVCSVCTVPTVVVTEGCGSVQCLHCASCCYRRVRECAVFALCQLLLFQKGAGVCSVCTVPAVVVTEGCGSVQCLHCASCCCFRRVRECAVFALCQLLLFQKGAGVCSVCTVPAVVVSEGCGSVQCLHCANCCCFRRVRECAVFALCQLLSATSMGTRLEVLKEIGKFFHDNTEKYGYSQLVDGRNKYMRCLLRFERSLQDFTLSLAASIRREGNVSGIRWELVGVNGFLECKTFKKTKEILFTFHLTDQVSFALNISEASL